MSKNILSMLQGIPKNNNKIAKSSKMGYKHPPEFRKRVNNIVAWMIKWNKTTDCLKYGLLVNGIEFEKPDYYCQLHSVIRNQLKLPRAERNWRYVKAKDMEKMGASFDEIYSMWWGETVKMDPFRKNHLRRILSGVRC